MLWVVTKPPGRSTTLTKVRDVVNITIEHRRVIMPPALFDVTPMNGTVHSTIQVFVTNWLFLIVHRRLQEL